jgi:polar amino acid transport system substrate-binding protein
MSSFTDTKEREQVLDFVTYFNSGTSFLVKASGGPAIQGLDDLCGHNVGVESGTTQQTDAQDQNTKCTSAGKPAVNVQVFQDQNSTNLALSSGRVDVVMLDSQVAAYQAKLNPAFKVTGQTYGQAPYGIAVPKGTGMADAVLAALKDLMADGTYTSIMNKWSISSGAITNPVINGATS